MSHLITGIALGLVGIVLAVKWDASPLVALLFWLSGAAIGIVQERAERDQ